MLGAWVSFTVTVVVHWLELPEPSVAVHDTVVGPSGKVEPDAGLQLGLPTEQLSVAVAANVAVALPDPVHSTDWPTGHVMEGAVTSLTVTVA